MEKNPLIQLAGVPLSATDVKMCFPHLASPEKKILALQKSGELIRLKRNLYVVNKDLCDKETDIRLCANHMYGPSYVSLQWAMRFYGMIPEHVCLVTSVTTKRNMEFSTPLGRFSYMQVPKKYFAIGVESMMIMVCAFRWRQGKRHYVTRYCMTSLCRISLSNRY